MRRYAAIGLLLVGCAAALLYQTRRLGLTVDETSHFAAAYAYWQGEDVLEPPDAPPLTRAICGWVPRLLKAPQLRDTNGWKERDAYLIGAEILDRPNIRARRLLFYTRLPFLLFPLLIVFLLWHWGRQLFGEPVALLLAVCGALEPTILGHGVLINSDVPAAFGALWWAYTAWKYWCTPNVRRLLLLTLATVVAVLTKFTLLPLAIVTFGLALWKGPRLLAAIAIPLALYIGILAASQFQAQPVPAAEIQQFRGAGVPGWALPVVKLLARLPWPLQFVRGLLFIGGSLQGEGFTGYMLGRKIHGWVPLYFPLAWAIKFPIPLQLLTAAGLAALVIRIRHREATSADLFVWGTAAFFLGTAVLSNFHIGFRHVLPALPLLILGGGFALARWSAHRGARVAIALSLVWLAASSLHVYPHGISYFNEWVGGPGARLEIPGRQQSRLGAGSTRPGSLPGAQSHPPREDLHLRLRQPVPLPQARQHGPADAAFAGRFRAAALLPAAAGPLCGEYEFSGGLSRPRRLRELPGVFSPARSRRPRRIFDSDL